MKILNLFPVEFFEFENKKINPIEIKDRLDKINCETLNSSVISYLEPLHKNKDFQDLFLWFNQCLEEIKTQYQYDCDAFEITSSWFNKSLAGQGMYQNYHKHTMSFFSAVYYLSNGSPTVFEDPVFQRSNAQLEVLRKNYRPIEIIEATPGKLIIFPSWVFHQTLPHYDNNDRCVISFNCLPVGNINSVARPDAKCFISIKND